MVEKKSPLTERQQTFIDCLMGSCQGDIRAAMNEAGYSSNTSFRDAIAPIKDHIIEAASMQLAMNAPKAVAKLVGVLDTPEALGNRNTIAAAERVLDRVGLAKTERLQIETTQPGVFILPPKDQS